MSEENTQEQQEQQRVPLSQLVGWGGGTMLTALSIDMLAHLGPTGIVVGVLAAFVAARHGPDMVEQAKEHFMLPALPPLKIAAPSRQKIGGRTFLDRALGRDASEVQTDELESAGEAPLDTIEDTNETEDTVFVQATVQTEVPGIPRITVEQIAEHLERNSYEVYIGRSMTRPNNPAVKINFYKRHLKLIGASQHGKSSMAAALLDTITRTHDPDRVQVAILDLEDRTGRLFADLPHIQSVRKDGATIRLHARSYEQVLEHLGHVCALIDYRYGLTAEELEQQPLLIAYLEEFVDLKDYFKQRINAVESDEKEQAKRDYTQLVYYIKKVAARGLKVLVQLLMCAQVDYRDDDLQAALVNVTSGMSFCVRVSAAQAAGFYQSELLARNAREDKVGQAVVEMPDCKDLILAPEYDLGVRLKALATYHHPLQSQILDISIGDGANTHRDMPSLPQVSTSHDLARALQAYDEGNTTVHALALALDMSPWNIRPLYTQVKKMRVCVG